MGMSVQKHFVTAQQIYQNLATSCKEAISFLRVFMKVVQYILSKIVAIAKTYTESFSLCLAMNLVEG